MRLPTEKVDGTNARILLFPDGNYIIGSRTELLYTKGDLIGNPTLGIVEALKNKAESLDSYTEDRITVYFGEVYGGKVTQASRQYTSDKTVGFRLFDIAQIHNPGRMLEKQALEISKWREGGCQHFISESKIMTEKDKHCFKITPRLMEIESDRFPVAIEEILDFLRDTIPRTFCKLDSFKMFLLT